MANRLANSTSPYLLQHADNPVDWHEWDDEALGRARSDDKPILLSIGYAACHWCHVMAHESFEDPETAELMNRLFVNVKLDREERPDLDRVYQLAHQVLQRRGGGWPLTAFLDPHTHQPFFIGTYFPREPRHGLPAFRTVLQRVADWYRDEPDARRQHNQALAEFLARAEPPSDDAPPAVTTIEKRALAAFVRDFDAEHGGFTPAPKFPHAAQIEWLLRRPEADAQRMARFTLDRMCRSGLFDQVGGGFYRYSVDGRWEIPHFEKMLYDNGSLLAALATAGADDPLFARAARMTSEWLTREMQHPDGGFYSSLDADSEGHEGRYYLWTPEQVRALLPGDRFAVFGPAFGLDRPANFEGAWHLHNADDTQLALPAFDESARRLYEARERRVRPGLDDKVLAAWNGLAIRGLAMAARTWREPAWTAAALRAARFIQANLWRDGRLATSWREGRTVSVSFLDDHAFLLDGLIELLQTEFDADLLRFAVELADALLERFADDAGGFWFTAHDHEKLIHRPKSFIDEATPNGNAVAALALNRVGRLVGDLRYTDAAAATLKAATASFRDWPHAHATALLALDEHERPPVLAVLRADAPVGGDHGALSFTIPTAATGLPGQLARQPAIDGQPTLYRCVGLHCEPPQVLT